jgi:hypothetical protein
MTSTAISMSEKVLQAKFPNPRNEVPSVLSFDKIDAVASVWIGEQCAKSSLFGSCLSSFSTSLFVVGLREVNPSIGGDDTADEDIFEITPAESTVTI